MIEPGDADAFGPDAFSDALLAVRMCLIDPAGLGGLLLTGNGGAADALVAALAGMLPPGMPLRRMPVSIDDEGLLGGLDLAATLHQGKAVSRRGLLAEADGGCVVVRGAERLDDQRASRIAAVLDTGEVAVERDAMALREPARFALLAVDEAGDPDEPVPTALRERLAFHIDLRGVRAESLGVPAKAGIPAMLPPSQEHGSEVFEALVATAAALGIESTRACLFAVRAARAAAALSGRSELIDEDIILAVRLILIPRATQLPGPEEAPAEAEPPPPQGESDRGEDERSDPGELADIVLAAVRAQLPPDMLERIAEQSRRGPSPKSRGSGERRRAATRGRPLGSRAGLPRGGARLSLIDTLRAAAPWQTLRGGGDGDPRIRIRRDDLRIRRFEARAETTTIFAVDASGSSAMARLAEAKGAVELLLGDAYVKRAQVALVAFRGSGAELLLPPTRSLARARRSLADLPGGGGTPLAAGLDAARQLAEAERKKGRTPFVVVLTDGRANVAADGSMVRRAAEEDATQAARAIGLAGFSGAFIDISTRVRPDGARLAQAMGARYVALPRADAAGMHRAVCDAQARP